jgi:hypothetical protein
LILPSGDLAVAWEASRRIVTWDDYETEAVTTLVSSYMGFGFDLVTPALIESDELPRLPKLRRWGATLTADDVLTLRSPNGQRALEPAVATDVIEPIRGALAKSEWLVALTGVVQCSSSAVLVSPSTT